MIHVYKKGGAWKTKEGVKYTVKAINRKELKKFLDLGFSSSLDSALSVEVKKDGDNKGQSGRASASRNNKD